jgi:hypothetical protein
MLAWHFLRDDQRLSYPPHTLVEVGQKMTVEPPLELCRWGLHASKRALDALGYAPGIIACRVELSGEILEDDDKVCATERTVLSMIDATNILHEFACWCAEQALLREREAGQKPNPRIWAAIEAKRKWLRGEITDSELETAKDAARDAAKTAAVAAAYTAWAAAYAADQTARAAAWEAAWDAAREAAWTATRAAAWAAQNTRLEKMLLEAMETI